MIIIWQSCSFLFFFFFFDLSYNQIDFFSCMQHYHKVKVQTFTSYSAVLKVMVKVPTCTSYSALLMVIVKVPTSTSYFAVLMVMGQENIVV